MKEFLEEIPPPGLYGFKEQTLQSLLLAHVAINGQENGSLVDHVINVSPGGISIITALENYVLRSEKQSKVHTFIAVIAVYRYYVPQF